MLTLRQVWEAEVEANKKGDIELAGLLAGLRITLVIRSAREHIMKAAELKAKAEAEGKI